jgi:aerobic-type carbon monoxide dehydrogenase small subunit (CoxS/CutS family)
MTFSADTASGTNHGSGCIAERKSDPGDDDIDNVCRNLCRCRTYQRIRRSIHRASKV